MLNASDTHAVVIGGSMAGLCAGAVLSRYYSRVTVLDRDEYPADVASRAGVPQSRHVHILLARGRRELDLIFPGFARELLARGALELDFGLDFAALWQGKTNWEPRASAKLSLLFASRNLVDAVVRDSFRKIQNATIRERCEVHGLSMEETWRGRRVTGVRVRARGGESVADMRADLVVDASGRSSRAPEWFREAGMVPPDEVTVDALMGYSSRWFKAPARWPDGWWWKGVWIDGDPPNLERGGSLCPVEDGKFVITVAGASRDYPPTDEEGLLAWMRTLRSPLLAEAAQLSEPISPIYTSRTMSNRLRKYDSWRERLAGFIAIGDSAAAFNPINGQGMTTAAVCSGILGECVKEKGPLNPSLPPYFFRKQANFLRAPWEITTSSDFQYKATIGERPKQGRLIDAYLSALFQSTNDPQLIRAVYDVTHMLKPPSSFLSPAVATRVLLNTLKRRLQGPAPAVPLTPRPGPT